MLYRTACRPASRARLVAPHRRDREPGGLRAARGRAHGARLPEVSPRGARWLRLLAGALVMALLFAVLLSAT